MWQLAVVHFSLRSLDVTDDQEEVENEEELQGLADAWVQQVLVALKKKDSRNPRIEIRAIYDEERPVEVVLEYVLE